MIQRKRSSDQVTSQRMGKASEKVESWVFDRAHYQMPYTQKFDSRTFVRFGRPFIGAFRPLSFDFHNHSIRIQMDKTEDESPIGIVLSVSGRTDYMDTGRVKLGFGPGTVLVEAIHGVKGTIKYQKLFQKATGEHWPNFIIKKMEATARRLGYGEVRIRDVETLYYYKRPWVDQDTIVKFRRGHSKVRDLSDLDLMPIIRKEIQNRMKKFYSELYQELGYTKRAGDYFVKEL